MHIVTPARMREIEGYAIGQLGIDGLVLMERAALSLAQEIRAASPRAVLAICGSGNGFPFWKICRTGQTMTS